MSLPRIINHLWAWVSTDATGQEGLISVQLGRDHMPLVGADQERMKSLLPYAQAVATESGYPVSLIRYTTREVILTLHDPVKEK